MLELVATERLMIDRLHREGAVLSNDRRFRYALSRGVVANALPVFVQPPKYCAFVLLNPSTASETVDDATVRKCRGFTQRWGYTTYSIVNLFALRATDPDELRKHPDLIAADEAENDRWILAVARHAELVVAGWGNHGTLLNRGQRVRALLQGAGIPLHCWKLNQGTAEPVHPLYMPYTQPLELVPVRGVA